MAELTPPRTRCVQRSRPRTRLLPGGVALAVTLALAAPLTAQLVPCRRDADDVSIAQALRAIGRSVDPCGESSELRALLDVVARCSRATYEICTDTSMRRNVFDRADTRTITWNPDLSSALEMGCTGDPHRPVERDPTASLVHELAHAAQDCEGLNPGEHELEAVRLENVYRRAAGLCQRRGYGEELLPAAMVKTCSGMTACRCSGAAEVAGRPAGPSVAAATPGRDGVTSSGDSRAP